MTGAAPHPQTDPRQGPKNWGLIIAGLVALLAYGGMARLDWQFGTLRAAHVPQTIGWYLLAFAAYIGALLWAERRHVSMRWVWLAAICFRLVLLSTTPTLSDDVYRYLWDGHVANNGVSPYAYPIEAPALDYLDTSVRSQANNRWMASPYLPAAQGLFSAVTALFPLKPFYFQAVMVLFDLAGAWLIANLLALARLPRRRLLLYLWNPLVIVEVAHGAHVDAWMVFLALLSVALSLNRSQASSRHLWPLAPLLLALATLTKPLPLLLLPVLFWVWRWRQRLVYLAAVVGLLIPSAMRAGWGLTGPLTGQGLFGAIRIYGAQWSFNGGLFRTLQKALGQPIYGTPSTEAKAIAAFTMLLGLLLVWRRARSAAPMRDHRTALRLMAVPLMAHLLLSPTVHPWYALFLLAFVPFLPPTRRERWPRWLAALPWLYFSGALIFSYLTYLDPQNFAEREWVQRLQWAPTYLLLLVAIAATLEFPNRRRPS